MTVLYGFAAGIAFCCLLDKLQHIRRKKREVKRAGELDQCAQCSYRKLFDDLGDD